MSWPFPGDSPVARARRVAHAYRASLEAVAPEVCADMDRMMRQFGQLWAVPGVLAYDDPDAWLTPADAAELVCVEVDTIRQMRRRGVLKGRYENGGWRYRAGDVLDCFARPRGRKTSVTDTLSTSGTSVSGGEQ